MALSVAEWMLLALMSMPREDLKRLESVMVKRPEPEYASMRWVILGEEEVGDGGGKTCSRM